MKTTKVNGYEKVEWRENTHSQNAMRKEKRERTERKESDVSTSLSVERRENPKRMRERMIRRKMRE